MLSDEAVVVAAVELALKPVADEFAAPEATAVPDKTTEVLLVDDEDDATFSFPPVAPVKVPVAVLVLDISDSGLKVSDPTAIVDANAEPARELVRAMPALTNHGLDCINMVYTDIGDD